HTYTHTLTHTDTHTLTHTDTHARTHTHTYTHRHTHTHTRKLKGLRDTMAIVMILPSSVQAGIILMVYSPSPFIHFADMPTNQAVHCGCTFSSVSSLSEN